MVIRVDNEIEGQILSGRSSGNHPVESSLSLFCGPKNSMSDYLPIGANTGSILGGPHPTGITRIYRPNSTSYDLIYSSVNRVKSSISSAIIIRKKSKKPMCALRDIDWNRKSERNRIRNPNRNSSRIGNGPVGGNSPSYFQG